MTIDSVSDLPDLLADLHVHLLGTGDTDFWRNQLEALPKDHLLEGVNPSVQISVRDLLERNEILDGQLVIPSDLPPCEHDVFSRYLKLRQSIALQRASALKDLIIWNAGRYKTIGIYYVEFSIGAGWLIGRQFASAVREGIESALVEYGVHIRILLAFNRKHTSLEIHNESFLSSLYDRWDAKLGPFSKPEYFQHHIELLREAASIMESELLSKYVVGFDYMGDERNAPYPPFLLPDFFAFVERQRERNHRFGIRLHAGELVFPSTESGYVSLRITHHFLEQCWMANIPTRIGHGMGTALLSDKLWEKWLNLYGPVEARRGWTSCYETLRTATMEVCLTSNRILTGVAPQENPAREYLENVFFYCVLGTDDADVFGRDLTLADEYMTVLGTDLIGKKLDIDQLIEESLQGSFAPPEILQEINANISCQPADQEPPDSALSKINRLLRYDKPHKAIDELWRIEPRYRRSKELWRLRIRADEDLRDLHAREGSPRNYGDWTPPGLR